MVTNMRTRYSKTAACLGLICTVLAVSTGLIAARARLAPHQLTIFFTGDDWGKYEYCT